MRDYHSITFRLEQFMKNKYFLQASKRLQDEFNINILDDVILGMEDRVILYADISHKENITYHVIAGSLEMIGFEDHSSITFEQLIAYFNYDNKYAEVGGKIEHYTNVTEQILDFSKETDVTFPIITNHQESWLKYTAGPIKGNLSLISVTITNVTRYYEKTLEDYEKMHKDSLTRLFNKNTLDYHYGLRYHFKDIHIFFLDLDNFKSINDTEGHDAGNKCLVQFADILKSLQHDYNLFYRVGGDEFVGLFFGDESYIKSIAEEILTRVRLICTPSLKRQITVSIGIIKGTISENLIVKADSVLYEAKLKGKDRYIYKIEK